MLKLDPDWLSGATLYKQDQLWFPAGLVPIACAYVVVLEVVMIWGIYARRAPIFWFVVAQLFSVPLHIVGNRGLLVPTPDDVPARHPSSARIVVPPQRNLVLAPCRSRRRAAVVAVGALCLLQFAPRVFLATPPSPARGECSRCTCSMH